VYCFSANLVSFQFTESPNRSADHCRRVAPAAKETQNIAAFEPWSAGDPAGRPFLINLVLWTHRNRTLGVTAIIRSVLEFSQTTNFIVPSKERVAPLLSNSQFDQFLQTTNLSKQLMSLISPNNSGRQLFQMIKVINSFKQLVSSVFAENQCRESLETINIINSLRQLMSSIISGNPSYQSFQKMKVAIFLRVCMNIHQIILSTNGGHQVRPILNNVCE
jgi:hypothetical protein